MTRVALRALLYAALLLFASALTVFFGMIANAQTAHAIEIGEATEVRVTFYTPTGNRMASGTYPFVGAAACSKNFPFGTILELPDGRTVLCLDRGDGDRHWPNHWIDVFVPTYRAGLAEVEAVYGVWTEVVVLRWGWEPAYPPQGGE